MMSVAKFNGAGYPQIANTDGDVCSFCSGNVSLTDYPEEQFYWRVLIKMILIDERICWDCISIIYLKS